jgi:hypothetical protein
MPAPTIPQSADNIIRLARTAGLGEDDDIGRLLVAVTQLATACDAKREALPEKDALAVLKSALLKARTETASDARQVHRWRRWSGVARDAVIAACALAVAGLWAWDRVEVMRCDPAVAYPASGGLVCWVKVPGR